MSYTPITALRVRYAALTPLQLIGRLLLRDRRIYFEYDPAWIACGVELSPFKLPLQSGAVTCDTTMFDGLFGLFADSLPDGWGRLLLDRQLRDRGVPPELLSTLDRLAHAGTRGMGALCYEPDVGEAAAHDGAIDLDQLAADSNRVLDGEAGDMLTELIALAGSSAGARPKVLVGVSANRRRIVHGLAAMPRGCTPWLIKFASGQDTADCGAVEYAYSLMARAAGVQMMPTHLFPAARGPGYFGVERFDRCDGARVHMQTIAGLLHIDHRFPTMDYSHVLRATHALTRDVREMYAMFRLAAFNVFAHNRDDHAKNFSFLMGVDGTWRASPAYDLTFSRGPGGEQSTLVLGEGKAPGCEHLRALAKQAGIPKKIAEAILADVRTAVAAWPKWAKRAGVPVATARQIQRVLQAR